MTPHRHLPGTLHTSFQSASSPQIILHNERTHHLQGQSGTSPSASELSPSNHRLESPLINFRQDQPLLKVPYEIARKNHKNALRYVERERESVLDAFKKIANSTIPSTKDYRTYQNNLMLTSTYENTTLDSLEGMIAKMETLKRKLEGLHAEERMNHKHTKARIKHLEDLHNVQSVEDQTYNNWAKIRLDRFLVNYMLQSGYANSAKALAAEVGIEELVDIDVFLQYDKIRNSLENGSIQEALIWCAENKSALKKINVSCLGPYYQLGMLNEIRTDGWQQSELEYELRLQQYIELVRTRQQSKLLEATAHARKYLVSIDDPHSAVKAAGLLAYPPGTPIEPYKVSIINPAEQIT